ncbi:MAG: O-antigen ligase family protein [Actinomycetia bacterium]|nr:O-antigen ligase family protein [Actinomycetes bacterium]
MKNNRYSVNRAIILKDLFIFLTLFAIFYKYLDKFTHDDMAVNIVLNTLCLVIFIVSLYKIKLGLYLFIFFIPLLNSFTTILGARPVEIILYLFFALTLGFFVNSSCRTQSSSYILLRPDIEFDKELKVPIAFFAAVAVISSLITIYRYANFVPFITGKYYDLNVNVNRVSSTGSIFWTIKFFFNYIIGFWLIFIIFNIIKKTKDIIISIIVLIFSTVVSAAIVFYQYFFHPTFGSFGHWVEAGRFNSTFTDPNALGAFTALMFPVFLAMIIYLKRRSLKLLFGILFLPYLFMLFLAGSRSSVIGIIFVVLSFLVIGIIKIVKVIRNKIIRTSKIEKTIILICILLLVLIIIMLAVFSIIFINNIEDPNITRFSMINRTMESIITFNTYAGRHGLIEGIKSISNYRYIFWERAIHMFRDYPLTGMGPGTYIIELPNYHGLDFTLIDYSGNYYLQVLSEFGLIGIIPILFIFYVLIKKAAVYLARSKNIKKVRNINWILIGLFMSFSSMLIALIFGPHTNFIEIQFTFWLIIGLMISFIKVQNSSGNERGTVCRGLSQIDNERYYNRTMNIPGSGVAGKISFIVLIIIFTISFAISSITTLSINVKQNTFRTNANNYGFYGKEVIEGKEVEWISIDASKVLEKQSYTLNIPVKDCIPVDRSKPITMKIYIDNLLVKKVKIDGDLWHDIKVDIPKFTGEKFTLTISTSDSWTPKEMGINNDTREIGVMIGEIVFLD